MSSSFASSCRQFLSQVPTLEGEAPAEPSSPQCRGYQKNGSAEPRPPKTRSEQKNGSAEPRPPKTRSEQKNGSAEPRPPKTRSEYKHIALQYFNSVQYSRMRTRLV